MSRKNKGNHPPVSGRKKFKQSAQYLKPKDVSAEESAGSDYRKKLKERKWGTPSGNERTEFQFVEVKARPAESFKTKSKPAESSTPRHHKPYSGSMMKDVKLLITESIVGGASRNMEIFYETIPATENANLRFKPAFLVAEKGSDDNQTYWRISRYVGISQPDGKFNGEITEIGKFSDFMNEDVIDELASWCKKAGRDISTLKNHMFPEAVKITANTTPYGHDPGFGGSGGFGGFGYR